MRLFCVLHQCHMPLYWPARLEVTVVVVYFCHIYYFFVDSPEMNLFLQEPFQVEDLKPWFFPLPSSSCSIVPGSNQDFMTSSYRVVISSPVVLFSSLTFRLRRETNKVSIMPFIE